MNIEAIQTGLSELKAGASREAHATFIVDTNGMHVYFRPNGFHESDVYIIAYGKTPEDALDDAKKQWAAMSARVNSERIKKIALAIIRITHEQGLCTDAALRVEFSNQDIDQYSGEALQLANKMADNGPFEIVELAGANAA